MIWLLEWVQRTHQSIHIMQDCTCQTVDCNSYIVKVSYSPEWCRGAQDTSPSVGLAPTPPPVLWSAMEKSGTEAARAREDGWNGPVTVATAVP